MPLPGVLLVGGASERFGSPKALARFRGETLADRGRRVLEEACDEVLVVGKAAAGLPFAVIDDGTPSPAPVHGVIAGLRAARYERRRCPPGRRAAHHAVGAARARRGRCGAVRARSSARRLPALAAARTRAPCGMRRPVAPRRQQGRARRSRGDPRGRGYTSGAPRSQPPGRALTAARRRGPRID